MQSDQESGQEQRPGDSEPLGPVAEVANVDPPATQEREWWRNDAPGPREVQ